MHLEGRVAKTGGNARAASLRQINNGNLELMAKKLRIPAINSVADKLIDAAEALYGKHGLDGVSLRQIGSEAGTSNNYAVQYHFGDIAGLIQSIHAKRLPAIHARQAQLLSQIEAEGRLSDTRALLDALFRPLLEQVDSTGERTYARFIFALLSTSAGVRYSGELIYQSDEIEITRLLGQANPDIPSAVFGERLRLMSLMILTSVFNRLSPFDGNEFDAALIDDALDTASTALSTPLGDSMREMQKCSQAVRDLER